jgi:hypothetical protein
MIFDVLKRLLYFVGRAAARLIMAGAIGFLLLRYDRTPLGPAELLVVFGAATLVAVVAHELGHLLACRAVGVKVKAFRLGDERYAIRFRVQAVQVSLGWPYKGRVEHEGSPSVGRGAVITLAGSLVDLALAGRCWRARRRPLPVRALGRRRSLSHSGSPRLGLPASCRTVAARDGCPTAPGYSNCDPARARPNCVRCRRRQSGYGRWGATMRRRNSTVRRRWLSRTSLTPCAGFGPPAGRDWQAQALSLHDIEYNLLCVPGLPPGVIDEAAVRMRWLVDNYPFNPKKDSELRPAMEHTLALARLRQGRFNEVEPLCASGLALDIGPDNRATLLATLVLARRALGQPHADVLAEAAALSPDADLVAEARSSADEPLISQNG